MKKILTLVIFTVLGFHGLKAQNGAVTIVNNSSCGSYTITLRAQSPSIMGTTGCADIRTPVFTICAGCTYSWLSPYDVEIGTSYCVSGTCPGSTPAIGWGLLPGSYTTVCGMACPGGNLWSGSYPSDWVWSEVIIDIGACCGIHGQLGIASCGGSTSFSGCGTSSGSISYTTTAPNNITVTIDP